MIISSAFCDAISLLRAVCNQYYCQSSSLNGDNGNGDSDSDGGDGDDSDEDDGGRHEIVMEVAMMIW